jgi:hypothetical protein
MATLKRPDDTRAQREMDAIEFDVEALLNGPRPDDPATAAAWRDRRRQVFEHLTGHPTLDPRLKGSSRRPRGRAGSVP